MLNDVYGVAKTGVFSVPGGRVVVKDGVWRLPVVPDDFDVLPRVVSSPIAVAGVILLRTPATKVVGDSPPVSDVPAVAFELKHQNKEGEWLLVTLFQSCCLFSHTPLVEP